MTKTPTAGMWKTVWITGASSGIGRQMALLLDGKVAQVAVSSPEVEVLDDLAAKSSTIRSYPLDVTHGVAVAECVNAIEATAGPIDLAVLNAGMWTIMDVEAARYRRHPAGHGSELFRRHERTGGAAAADDPARLRPYRHRRLGCRLSRPARAIAYGPTKAALINLAETLRCELEPHGITVSLVNPGFVKTPMTAGNPFAMPGLMTADAAARRIVDGLQRRRYEIVFPRRFVAVMKLLRLLPNSLLLLERSHLHQERAASGFAQAIKFHIDEVGSDAFPASCPHARGGPVWRTSLIQSRLAGFRRQPPSLSERS